MKIVVASDGTSNSRAAAAALKKLHLGEGDSIHVVSIADLGVPISADLYGGYLPGNADTEMAATEACSGIVEEAIAIIQDLGAVHVTGEVLHGTPESQIVEAADRFSADLIVVGSRGSNTLERLLLGSVSDSVVHNAHCSVLVVRPHG